MSSVLKDSVCNPDSPSILCDRVQELQPSMGSGPAENGLAHYTGVDAPTVTSSAQLVLQHREREITALEGISDALKGVSSFLRGTTLTQALQTVAVNGAVQSLLGGLTHKDGRNGLDARNMNQNAIDIAHLIEAVFLKVSKHGASRTAVHDGEDLMGVPKE